MDNLKYKTNSDALLLQTLTGKSTSRPPVWFMRQAGRVLPSYMAIKAKHNLMEMMNTPEIGADVTLLPVNDLGVDAAILFSDILMIPMAMGMGLDFTEKGPVFDSPLSEFPNPLSQLKPDISKLKFVFDIIDKVKEKKSPNIPLIGFCGAPLTVMCYMIQGLGKNPDFPAAVKFFYQNKAATKQMIDAVTELTIEYAKKQIAHGVDVFQLFESHAGLIPNDLYHELFMPSVKKIGSAVRDAGIPFIYFPKGFGLGIKDVTPDVCDFMSIDWQIPIRDARKLVHQEIGLQGNLDPRILYADKTTIASKLEDYIQFGKENQKWIFNLGHGFLPDTPFENAKFLADWIKNADWKR